MNALKQSLQREPAFPDGVPSWRSIAAPRKARRPDEPLLSEIRSKSHRPRRETTSLGQDSQQERFNDLIGRALWVLTRCLPHLHQAHGKGRHQAQQAHEALNTLQLAVFKTAATFQTLMILLDQPGMGIPLHSLPGISAGSILSR